MNASVLELKENANFKPAGYQNGEWGVNLKQHMTLNDGDSVMIRNVFIDTVAASGGMIVIDKDTPVSVTFCRGWNFANEITDDTGTGENEVKLNQYQLNLLIQSSKIHPTHTYKPATKGDSHTYFELERTTEPNTDQNFTIARNMSFSSDFQNGWNKHYGGFKISFQYYDIKDNLQTLNTSLNNIDSPKTSNDVSFRQPLGDGAFIYNSKKAFGNGGVLKISPSDDDMINNHHTDPMISFDGDPLPSGDVFTLKPRTVSFIIKQGSYDPDNLARIITDEMTKVDDNDEKIFGPNMLPYNSEILGIADNEVGNLMYYISDSNQCLLSLKANDGGSPQVDYNHPITGASEFAFVFDGGEGGSNTFKFTSLHSPYYVNSAPSGQPANIAIGNKLTPVRTNPTDPTPLPPTYLYYNDDKKGEIILTGLSPPDFWFNKLGLNPNCIAQVNTQQFKYNDEGTDVTVRVPLLTLIDGVNRTKPFLGTDSLIPIKTVLIPAIADYSVPLLLNNLNTISIYGQKELSQITNTNGYFLVEVRGYNNGTRVIGANDVDQISAIVSRYYSSPSYTNGYSADAIVYTHVGEPVQLSNFTVRILDPDRSPAEGIGTNSCVYLMIERGDAKSAT